MPKNLVIVESPAKAKTIEKYLGKDFEVTSSKGHVRDLPKKNAIDIEKDFAPTYEISADKKSVVAELRRLAKQSKTIWLATDDDREGEAISWHLHEALELDGRDVKRIVFREITKSAITQAIQNPRGIDYNLVNAQQARRILDRLVGFEISPLLWKKIKSGLSAGRVQSVAVRLIVDRENEIKNFKATSFFKISADFLLEKGKNLYAELPKKLENQAGAKDFLEKCVGARFFIKNLETKPAKKSPAAPFTTSTLQQEASRKLGFPVGLTMQLAQKLYEAGKITYMRTDSNNISNDAIEQASAEIHSQYGKEYFQSRRFKNKSEGAQEAHEAIRPTDFSKHSEGVDRNQKRLYELIWKRAIASQMADAKLERTTAFIGIDPIAYNQKTNTQTQMPDLVAKGEVIKFEGFLKVYLESKEEEEQEDETTKGMLPPLKINQELNLNQMKALERFTRNPPRYTEASLVKKLEEMGIGRPSTYAPIISTVQKRGYIVKEDRDGKERVYRELLLKADEISEKKSKEIYGKEKAKLFPTDTASVVNDFLIEHFSKIMDYSFTANVEKEFDEIAKGQKEWVKMLKTFYKPFHQKIEETEGVERDSTGASRVLGNDPKTGEEVKVILGRFGAFVQLGEATEEEPKPPRASLRKEQRLNDITLEEAMELFKLPRIVGSFEDKEIKANVGRYGPYVQHDGKFISLKEDDPLDIVEARAIELIKAKRKADAERIIKVFDKNPDIQILKGRYGAYIKAGRMNVALPKEKKENPESLTLEECLQFVEDKKNNPGRKTSSRKKKQ